MGTQNHFRYTEKLGKPVIFLVNQLDREKCDFDNVLEQLKENYGSKVVPVQYPISTGPDFNSLIDVLLMKKYSGDLKVVLLPSKTFRLKKWKKLRNGIRHWLRLLPSTTKALMEKFFESESLTEDEMREGIRKGLAAQRYVPGILRMCR